MRKAIWLVLVAAASAFAYTVTVDTGDVNIKPTEDPAFLGYDVVTLAGGGVIPAAPGEPALPGVTVTVSIPRGMEIESVDVSTGDPVELPGTYRVMPIQEPTAFSASAATPTPANDKVYSSAEAFPGKLAYSFGSGNMGGYGVGSICLAPVQYVPATGKVLLYPILDFDVKLRPAEGELVYPAVRLEWMDRQVREALAAQVINPWEVAPATGVRLLDGGDSLDGPPYPYLIITNSAMATAAQELADWKTKKGLNATVVTTEDIESGYTGVDTAEKIRNCIKEYFTQYGTEYVCLIGTNSIIPVRKVYDPQYNVAEGDNLVPTDNYYGCLDGSFNEDGDGYWGEYNDDNVDWVYDVYVGRLHVATEAELVEVIDKTLCYEGTELSTEVNPYDYQDEMILAGGWADSSTNLKLMMEYIRDNYLTSSHWSFTELWDDTYPGGTVFNGTNFTAEMNGGRGLVAHMAHCNTTTLGTNSGGVSSSTLLGLSNHPEFMGFLYSVGCYASNTDHDNNCGAYFVAAPDGAGVGFCCNTRYGWYSRGDPLNHYSQEFFKEYFRQFAVEDVYVAGQLNAFHKHALQSYLSAYIYRYIYFELIHTGDPELWVPNGAIGALTVGFDDQIPVASQTYDVHVADAMNADVEGALVCLWKGEEVYASDLTSSSGDVSFSIEPTTTGYMYLTVSGHNCETFEADVGVGTTGVELTSFEGRRVESGIVLNWTVSEGAGVESYNLYRRPVNALAAPTGGGATANAMAGAFGSNGATAAAPTNDGWTLVNGDPIVGKSPYRYMDAGVESGVFEYKLEAVMAAAGMNELGTTRVEGTAPRAFSFNVAPNPAATTAKLMINMPTATEVVVRMYDLSGRRVGTVLERPVTEGTHEYAMDVSGMPAGIYILHLEGGGHVSAKRVAVVH